MQKVLLTATIAVSLTISTIVIICSLDGLAVCGPGLDNSVRFYAYKDYCILPYITKNQYEDNASIFERITLTLHISNDYLDDKITEQVEAWEGPITLTIMIQSTGVFNNIRNVQHKISKLPKHIVEKLSCHVLFYSGVGCELNAMPIIEKRTLPKLDYPVNVVRNAARMFVRSKYLLLADYEFVFSNGFESRMRKLAMTELARNPKTALVYRIFEVNETVNHLPRNKTELHALYRNGTAVEFHAKFTSNAHKIPNLLNWFTRPDGTGGATISSELQFTRHDWEPQFVSLNTIPLHDENFPFSLRDNTELRWEMCRMNYKFVLVDDLFMVHRGIKTIKDLPHTRQLQKQSRPKFIAALSQFQERMDREYPETKTKCPKFGA